MLFLRMFVFEILDGGMLVTGACCKGRRGELALTERVMISVLDVTEGFGAICSVHRDSFGSDNFVWLPLGRSPVA